MYSCLHLRACMHISLHASTFAGMYPLAHLPTDLHNKHTCDRTHKQENKHTNTYTHLHTYIHTCIHTYMRLYTHTYVHTYMHACIHTNKQVHTHIYISNYMHWCTHACSLVTVFFTYALTEACAWICNYMYVCMQCLHAEGEVSTLIGT